MNQKGSAHLELVISAVILLPTLWGAVSVLRSSWNRARCATIVFDTARKAIEGSPSSFSRVLTTQLEYGVVAESKCGGAHEQIGFKNLE